MKVNTTVYRENSTSDGLNFEFDEISIFPMCKHDIKPLKMYGVYY